MYKLFKCTATTDIDAINNFMDFLLTFFAYTLPNSYNISPVEWLYTYPQVQNIPTLVNGDTSPFSGDGMGVINFPPLVDINFRYIYVKLRNHPRPMFFFVTNKFSKINYGDKREYNLNDVTMIHEKYDVVVSLGLYSFVNNAVDIPYPQGLRVYKEHPIPTTPANATFLSSTVNIYPFNRLHILEEEYKHDRYWYFIYNDSTFIIVFFKYLRGDPLDVSTEGGQFSVEIPGTHHNNTVIWYISPKHSISLPSHDIFVDFLVSGFNWFYNKDYADGNLFTFELDDNYYLVNTLRKYFPIGMNAILDANIHMSIIPRITFIINEIAKYMSYRTIDAFNNAEMGFIYNKISGDLVGDTYYNGYIMPYLFTSCAKNIIEAKPIDTIYPTPKSIVVPEAFYLNDGDKLKMNSINTGANTLNNHFNLYPVLIYACREPVKLGAVSLFCKAPLLYNCESDFLHDDTIVEYDTCCGKFLLLNDSSSAEDFAILVESKEEG